jgi:hypothetical protein
MSVGAPFFSTHHTEGCGKDDETDKTYKDDTSA